MWHMRGIVLVNTGAGGKAVEMRLLLRARRSCGRCSAAGGGWAASVPAAEGAPRGNAARLEPAGAAATAPVGSRATTT